MADAERLRLHLQHLLQAAMAGRGSAAPGALDVVVVGGGPTGVETTGAVAELMQALRSTGRHDPAGKITIVDRSSALLGQFSSTAHDYALGKLTEVGADVKLEVGVTAVHPDRVEFDDKTTTRHAPWCGAVGNRARQWHTRSGRSSAAADGSTSGPT